MTTITKVSYRGSSHFALPRVIEATLSDGRVLSVGHVKLAKVEWLRRFCQWNDAQVDAVGETLAANRVACEADAARPDHRWEFQAANLKRAVLADPATILPAIVPPREPRKGNWRSKAYEGGWSPYDEDADEAIHGPN